MIKFRDILYEKMSDVLKKYGITDDIKNGVGFAPKSQKWYGWSHRGIAGFGIGHIVSKGQCRVNIPIGFECKTLEDCKKVANDFARSIS